jgi:hypothetical protein
LAPIPNDAVRIFVEDGRKQQFVVHRSLICHFSPYFNKYFHGMEPMAKTMTIPAFTYVNELDFQYINDVCSESEIGNKRIEIRISLPAPVHYNEITLPKDLGRVRRPVSAAFIQWVYRAFPGQMFPPPDLNIDAPTLIELWVLAAGLESQAVKMTVSLLSSVSAERQTLLRRLKSAGSTKTPKNINGVAADCGIC